MQDLIKDIFVSLTQGKSMRQKKIVNTFSGDKAIGLDSFDKFSVSKARSLLHTGTIAFMSLFN